MSEPITPKKVACPSDGDFRSTNCLGEATPEAHTCPYKEDIDEDIATLCRCCKECQQQCEAEI